MKMFFFLPLFIICILMLFLIWSSYPWSIEESVQKGELLLIETEKILDDVDKPSVLKLLTYNVSYFHGKGSEGPGYEKKDEQYYLQNLNQFSDELNSLNADVVFLQEIDFASSRTYFLNQAEFLAKKSGYPYVAMAPSWISNYIPFPYWPLSNNFGKMFSGGAILSRFPIISNEVINLKKPKSNPWWYNLFYLHRYFQKVTIQVGEKKFNFINLHLEAFDKEDRQDQLKKLVDLIKKESIDFVAGDFNMLPENASKRSKFFNNDDYEGDLSYKIMELSGMVEVIPSDINAENENAYFTFPSWAPDRRLDYIWYNGYLKMMKAEVLSSAMSDHLPIMATFQIDSPKFNPYSQ